MIIGAGEDIGEVENKASAARRVILTALVLVSIRSATQLIELIHRNLAVTSSRPALTPSRLLS